MGDTEHRHVGDNVARVLNSSSGSHAPAFHLLKCLAVQFPPPSGLSSLIRAVNRLYSASDAWVSFSGPPYSSPYSRPWDWQAWKSPSRGAYRKTVSRCVP